MFAAAHERAARGQRADVGRIAEADLTAALHDVDAVGRARTWLAETASRGSTAEERNAAEAWLREAACRPTFQEGDADEMDAKQDAIAELAQEIIDAACQIRTVLDPVAGVRGFSGCARSRTAPATRAP